MTGPICQPGPNDAFLSRDQGKRVPRRPAVRLRCPAERQELPGDGDIAAVVPRDLDGHVLLPEKVAGRDGRGSGSRLSGQKDLSGGGGGVERKGTGLDRGEVSGGVLRPHPQGIHAVPRKGEDGFGRERQCRGGDGAGIKLYIYRKRSWVAGRLRRGNGGGGIGDIPAVIPVRLFRSQHQRRRRRGRFLYLHLDRRGGFTRGPRLADGPETIGGADIL